MTFQECESHPLWQAFKKYCRDQYNWSDREIQDWTKGAWYKEWQTFLAGAQAATPWRRGLEE